MKKYQWRKPLSGAAVAQRYAEGASSSLRSIHVACAIVLCVGHCGSVSAEPRL